MGYFSAKLVKNEHRISFAAGLDFLFVFKMWKQTDSNKLRNRFHSQENGPKNNVVGELIWCTLLSALAVVLLCFSSSHIGAEVASEAQLKTLYLFNFSRFVQWPESKNDAKTFRFCTYPENPFGAILHQLEQRTIQTKPIQINELKSVEDIKFCHVAFIALDPGANLEKVAAIAKKYHVLTISDQNEFVNKGGMIQMFIEKGKIRFNINFDTSQGASLQIDSKLLQLASGVIKTTTLSHE